MLALRNWDPFAELARFEDDMKRFMGPAGKRGNVFSPAVDILEDKEAVILSMELPGMKSEDVHVQVEDGYLTIRGERKHEKETSEKNVHRLERSYGEFTRSFLLPENVKADAVVASLKDGVLKLQLPKTEQAKPKKVEIKVPS
jgi:HSP20 family protein